jgi:hypothetical protein
MYFEGYQAIWPQLPLLSTIEINKKKKAAYELLRGNTWDDPLVNDLTTMWKTNVSLQSLSCYPIIYVVGIAINWRVSL